VIDKIHRDKMMGKENDCKYPTIHPKYLPKVTRMYTYPAPLVVGKI
jgi:hypothetical protein